MLCKLSRVLARNMETLFHINLERLDTIAKYPNSASIGKSNMGFLFSITQIISLLSKYFCTIVGVREGAAPEFRNNFAPLLEGKRNNKLAKIMISFSS